MEIAGLPEVTQTLTFYENTLTEEPKGMVLMGVRYVVSAGEEDPQAVWETLAQQAEEVLPEDGDIALLTPENGVAQGQPAQYHVFSAGGDSNHGVGGTFQRGDHSGSGRTKKPARSGIKKDREKFPVFSVGYPKVTSKIIITKKPAMTPRVPMLECSPR